MAQARRVSNCSRSVSHPRRGREGGQARGSAWYTLLISLAQPGNDVFWRGRGRRGGLILSKEDWCENIELSDRGLPGCCFP